MFNLLSDILILCFTILMFCGSSKLPDNHSICAYFSFKLNFCKDCCFHFLLRSGEEGHFPDLVNFTEERLKRINPNRYARNSVCQCKFLQTSGSGQVITIAWQPMLD